MEARIPKRLDVNLNTLIIVVGFAALWYLSQIFLTKEAYYRDQNKLESRLDHIDSKQEQIVSILLDRPGSLQPVTR